MGLTAPGMGLLLPLTTAGVRQRVTYIAYLLAYLLACFYLTAAPVVVDGFICASTRACSVVTARSHFAG